MKWYKKLHRELKKAWDNTLRPVVEPLLTLIIVSKTEKELNRHL